MCLTLASERPGQRSTRQRAHSRHGRRKTAKERAQILRKWFDLMIAETESLAQLMTSEQGKPLAEARGEVAYGAAFVEWFAEEGKRAYGKTIPTTMGSKRYITIKQPIGVVAAIAPWNFPDCHDHAQGGARAGCRLHHRREARGGYAALRTGHCQARDRCGRPRRRLQCDHHAGSARRRQGALR